MPTMIGSLLDGDTFASSEKDKVNLLNRYLSRIHTIENMNNRSIGHEAAHSNGSTLSNVVITPKAVQEKLGIINCIKSQAPDGIHA